MRRYPRSPWARGFGSSALRILKKEGARGAIDPGAGRATKPGRPARVRLDRASHAMPVDPRPRRRRSTERAALPSAVALGAELPPRTDLPPRTATRARTPSAEPSKAPSRGSRTRLPACPGTRPAAAYPPRAVEETGPRDRDSRGSNTASALRSRPSASLPGPPPRSKPGWSQAKPSLSDAALQPDTSGSTLCRAGRATSSTKRELSQEPCVSTV